MAARIEVWLRRARTKLGLHRSPGGRRGAGELSAEEGWSRSLSGFGTTLVRAGSLGQPVGSRDETPWAHPFLSAENISRFRAYSEFVWDAALAHARAHPRKLRLAFSVNMAQNMYTWARLAAGAGAEVALFCHPWDGSALSAPEWEEFDGTYPDPLDREGFLQAHPELRAQVPVRWPRFDLEPFASELRAFARGEREALLRRLAAAPELRMGLFFACPALSRYAAWAQELASYDAIYTASLPLAALLSGRPYCAFSVGGDLALDCGRPDAYGELMTLSFAVARFLLASNPHTLGHARRLGLGNAVYLPYPVDDATYCPGPGRLRPGWESELGPGVYVLNTARLDTRVKGQGATYWDALAEASRACPDLRFLFVAWGEDAERLQREVLAGPLAGRVRFLEPAGKRRMLDYYRSSDIVLDQMVLGYYGATALEAAATGRPVVMRLRRDQYEPLYRGDVAPVVAVQGTRDLATALVGLAGDRERRETLGRQMRAWLVRNHGKDRTVPLLLALLQLCADRRSLEGGPPNPLRAPLTEEEKAYHASRAVRGPA